MSLYEKYLQGDRRALARLITHVENRKENYRQLLALVSKQPHHAYRIGITGPPGAGKSTLVDLIVDSLARRGNQVGIIAVDPSSPFTGGALLGDRIRMQHLSNRENIFIRSMASRGMSGGLSAATRDVTTVLDAFGMDFIFIETVGIGQIELDIVDACDTVVVILVPESGDFIQTMKAGLMEIADIFCVNKSDREGAERLITILNSTIHERLGKDSKEFPAVGTNGISGDGVEKLMETILQHREFITSNGSFERRRKQQVRAELLDAVRERIMKHLETLMDSDEQLEKISAEVCRGETDPYNAAEMIYDHYIGGRLING